MAYDYFSDTPFDLNHDGKIDSNEAAYIYETFFNEDNDKQEPCEDDSLDLGYDEDPNRISYKNTSPGEKYSYDAKEILKAADRENHHKNMFIIGVVLVLLLVFSSSPGVGLFVGGILMILKWSKGF